MIEKEGYKKPHGYSGANAGIPFNIIALANGDIMVNPRYVPHEVPLGAYVKIKSNCGSLLLEKPIEINRFGRITVKYIDYNSMINLKPIEVSKTGFLPTVQHEVDHNYGILITDRRV